jgi:phospholipid transport system substrate-binding protein
MKRVICILTVGVVLLASTYAAAATPLQTVENRVHQLLSVLKDRSLSGKVGEEKKKAEIRSISNSLFDFTELSRFTLGAGWRRFDPQQRKRFVDLYRELLESVYMSRLLEYKDQKVIFKREVNLSDTRREVQTAIVTDNGDIPMNYRMIQKDGVWKVYDVIIENVSLAGNYRSQFRSILSQDTPDQLLSILSKKINQDAKGSP